MWMGSFLMFLFQHTSLGNPGPNGRPQVKYGPLFVETANMFEALSGTLKTAKKYQVWLDWVW